MGKLVSKPIRSPAQPSRRARLRHHLLVEEQVAASSIVAP